MANPESDPTPVARPTHEGEHAAGQSARFRIVVDALGRVIPKIIPVDLDQDDPKAAPQK